MDLEETQIKRKDDNVLENIKSLSLGAEKSKGPELSLKSLIGTTSNSTFTSTIGTASIFKMTPGAIGANTLASTANPPILSLSDLIGQNKPGGPSLGSLSSLPSMNKAPLNSTGAPLTLSQLLSGKSVALPVAEKAAVPILSLKDFAPSNPNPPTSLSNLLQQSQPQPHAKNESDNGKTTSIQQEPNSQLIQFLLDASPPSPLQKIKNINLFLEQGGGDGYSDDAYDFHDPSPDDIVVSARSKKPNRKS